MSGYLEDYGVAEQRRERLIKRIVIAGVLAAAAAAGLYYQFRNFREERQIKRFLRLLENKDYRAAYTLWGCTEAHPCPNYSYQKFLEDWGPDGVHAAVSAADITRTRSCAAGIIQTLRFAEDDEVWLWVSRDDRTISYAPWPTCAPRLPASTFRTQPGQ